jgi:photosystem II stability/assembly factor-like uncharacterized protein
MSASFLIRLVTAVVLVAGAQVQAQDSSESPAEAMPLASRSMLLDLVSTPDRSIAVGERGHVMLSEDGENWRQASVVPTRSTLTAVTAVGQNLWAVGHDVVIIHSSDGGENWEIQQVDIGMMQPLLDVFFLDQSNGFAIGAYGYFLRTRDGGSSWEEGLVMAEDAAEADPGEGAESDDGGGGYDFSDYEDEFTDFHMNAMVALPDGTLFVAAEAGNALQSVDGGESWTLLSLPYEGSMFGALVAGDGTLVTFGLRGHVLESVDAGLTWVEPETGTLNSLLGGTVLPDGTMVLAGANGEILIRDADGYHSTRTSEGDDLAAAIPGADGGLVLVGENGVTKHALAGDKP